MNSTVANDRSWTMLEGLSGTVNIYGNVFLGLNGAGSGNGLCGCCNQGVVFNVYDNTIVAKNGSNNIFNFAHAGTLNIRNNIIRINGQTTLTGDMPRNRSYNLWFGPNSPSCVATEICSQDPLFTNYTSNDFSLQSGSPARSSGTNLGAGFDRALAPGSTWPNPTEILRVGSWDRGAYQGTGGGCPSRPNRPQDNCFDSRRHRVVTQAAWLPNHCQRPNKTHGATFRAKVTRLPCAPR